MLNDFHRRDDIKLAQSLCGDFACAVCNGQSRQRRMRGCGVNIFGRGINACYLRPHTRQWFTQQPRTAANIKRRLA